MPYARLLYQGGWATKHRHPARDVMVYAVGVMTDHVHVFAQIPPALTVARWTTAIGFRGRPEPGPG